MAWIVDASAAIALLIESARTETVREIIISKAELTAPDILIAETTNGIWNHRRTRTFSAETVQEFLEGLRANVTMVPCSSLVRAAFSIAIELDHPTYDAFYLALARRDGAQLVTFDERLKRKVAGTKYESLILNT